MGDIEREGMSKPKPSKLYWLDRDKGILVEERPDAKITYYHVEGPWSPEVILQLVETLERLKCSIDGTLSGVMKELDKWVKMLKPYAGKPPEVVWQSISFKKKDE